MRETDLFQFDTFRVEAGSLDASWTARTSRCLPYLSGPAEEGRKSAGLHGREGWRSALEIIVQYEVQAFAHHPLFNRLIELKWNKFGRRLYVANVVAIYFLLLGCFAAAVFLRCQDLKAQNSPWTNASAVDPNYTIPGTGRAPTDGQCGWYFNKQIEDAFEEGGAAAASMAMEGILAGPWALWLVWSGWVQCKIALRDLDINDDAQIQAAEVQEFVFKNLHFVLNVLSGLALFFAGVCRVQCWTDSEICLLAAASITLFCNALSVLVPFRYVGEMVITVYRMIVGDIFRFLTVYFLLWCGFSFAMALLCQRTDMSGLGMDGNEPDNPGEALLHLSFTSLGDNIGGFIFDLYPRTPSGELVLAVYLVWVVLSSILVSLAKLDAVALHSNPSFCQPWLFSEIGTQRQYCVISGCCDQWSLEKARGVGSWEGKS